MRHPSSSSSLSGTMTTAPKTPCCAKVGLKKGPWTPEEDELLSNYINKEGEGRWRTLPNRAGLLRCGKSCRLRWMNYLRPNVKRGQIAPDEEDLILRLHRLLGNRWSLIAGRIPGRTDNEIKNYWNTHLSKKLISQGIDPRNHKPLENTTTSSTTENNNNNAINNTVKVITHSSSKSVVNQIHQPEQPFNDPSSSASIINLEAERVRRGYTYTEQDQLAQFRRSIGDVEFISSGGGGGIENILSNPQGLRNHGVNNDFNYCSDDVFSSFLNSLMNEDVFSSIQHVQQQSSGIFSPAAPADGFEDPTTLLSSATAFNHKDPETTQLNHHPA